MPWTKPSTYKWFAAPPPRIFFLPASLYITYQGAFNTKATAGDEVERIFVTNRDAKRGGRVSVTYRDVKERFWAILPKMEKGYILSFNSSKHLFKFYRTLVAITLSNSRSMNAFRFLISQYLFATIWLHLTTRGRPTWIWWEAGGVRKSIAKSRKGFCHETLWKVLREWVGYHSKIYSYVFISQPPAFLCFYGT